MGEGRSDGARMTTTREEGALERGSAAVHGTKALIRPLWCAAYLVRSLHLDGFVVEAFGSAGKGDFLPRR